MNRHLIWPGEILSDCKYQYISEPDMQKFIIDPAQAKDGVVTIHGRDARHILKVLRLKPGDALSVTDGKRTDYQGNILRITPSSLDVQLANPTQSITESDVRITLCSGMLKHGKMDWIIENVVPLGVYEWIPFFCQRSIPRPHAKDMGKKMTRWNTIVRESMKQCRRSQLVNIHPPMTFEEMLPLSSDADLKLAFWEKEEIKPSWPQSSPKHIMLLIGPEGGFSKEEILLAQSWGFTSCSLGTRILRSEIATLCACTLVQHRFGDM